jgi:hypothetical protein
MRGAAFIVPAAGAVRAIIIRDWLGLSTLLLLAAIYVGVIVGRISSEDS